MKSLAKLTFGALALAGAALVPAQPAHAASSFGFSFGYGGGHAAVHYNPCYRPYYARPRYCRYPLHRGRAYFGGRWRHGPFHYRDYRGSRQYWHRGRWHRGYLHPPPRYRRGYNRGYRSYRGYRGRGRGRY